MTTYNKERFKELDALRGAAALLVVFFHFTMGRPEYNQFFKLGTTGVDLFFIISGFVISMSLQRLSRASDFVINRVSRLYPTYWAIVTFTFLLVSIHAIYNSTFVATDLIRYLGNLTMFQFYLRISNLDGPYWTMIIEMLFYISMLILFRLKLLNHLNFIGIFLCCIIVAVSNLLGDIKLVKLIIGGIPLFQFLPLFFVGTVFYKIYSIKKKLLANYSIVFFCLLSQILLFPYAGHSHVYIGQAEYNLVLSIYFLLFILFVNNKLKFIVNDVTLFLGKISYALYLVHQYISLKFIIPFFYQELGANFWVTAVLIDLPIIIGIAAFVTYKIEIPFSRIMKEKLRLAYA